jgi:hypothetical protein
MGAVTPSVCEIMSNLGLVITRRSRETADAMWGDPPAGR